jgi:hypothetical protein
MTPNEPYPVTSSATAAAGPIPAGLMRPALPAELRLERIILLTLVLLSPLA